MAKAEKPQVIKADFSLQRKVGAGPLNEAVVKNCQRVMDNNDVDFSPLAIQFLDEPADVLKKTKSGELSQKETVEKMAQSVMQLKANASTFKYTLVGNLATIMLSFLESIKDLDENAIEIVDAHHRTLSAIVIKKMKGDGGEAGSLMEEELRAACNRYFAKT